MYSLLSCSMSPWSSCSATARPESKWQHVMRKKESCIAELQFLQLFIKKTLNLFQTKMLPRGPAAESEGIFFFFLSFISSPPLPRSAFIDVCRYCVCCIWTSPYSPTKHKPPARPLALPFYEQETLGEANGLHRFPRRSHSKMSALNIKATDSRSGRNFLIHARVCDRSTAGDACPGGGRAKKLIIAVVLIVCVFRRDGRQRGKWIIRREGVSGRDSLADVSPFYGPKRPLEDREALSRKKV